MKTHALLAILFSLLGLNALLADPASVTVHVAAPGVKLSSDFYGLITEEINHSYDGGLYAELIQNRSFKDDSQSPVHWTVVQSTSGGGDLTLSDTDPVTPALSKTLELHIHTTSTGEEVGAANDGFWGIPVKPRTRYKASFYAEAADGFTGPLHVILESSDGHAVYASASTPGITSHWRQYHVELRTGDLTPSTTNRFVISAAHAGTVRLSLVSLFPPTYHDRPNGNRIDLMETLSDLKPAFLRFPGGNFVDPGHYEWKTTVGPLESRPGGDGAWRYHVSDGLGILEFFEWCEDLKMQPVLDVSDGRGWLAGNGDISPLVQDALDEVEYATGGVDTVWGAKRAADGHPKPFPLKYIEIGNEDFFDNRDVYNARFAKFYDAVRSKYPQLLIIATRDDVSSRVPDLVDDHYYRNPQDMEAMSTQYDNYDRKKPAVFVGEWRTSELEHNINMNDTLGDAAWLTGLERNADVVKMECYAPLLFNNNPEAYNTPANMIGYDTLSVFGTPSYYMQKMFANGHGDIELPVIVAAGSGPAQPDAAPSGKIGVGSWTSQDEYRNVKVTNGDAVLFQASSLGDWSTYYGNWNFADGVLAQTGNLHESIAVAGQDSWTDYTLSLQARKLGGDNGFFIYVHYKDADDCVRWQVSGWGNRDDGIDDITNGFVKPLSRVSGAFPEIGRWYDLRVEVAGRDIKCYIDGALVSEVQDVPGHTEKSLFVSATRETKSGAIWLHLVNTADDTQPITLNFDGARAVKPTAVGEILESGLSNYNSIENPKAIVPSKLTLSNAASSFTYQSPPHSISVIKFNQ